MPTEPTHRRDYGWRSSTIAGALRLRPPVAQISLAEGELLERYAQGAQTIVQIGVAEGGSAWHARRSMDPGGRMHLIDTYPRVLGANMSSIIARRLVGDLDRGDVNWIRARSDEVSPSWTESIDLLFVDGDHAYDAVKRDWKEWSPHVSDDGYVAFHDALVDAPWMNEDFGSARLVHELRHENEAWEIVDRADSLAVFARRRT